MTRLIMVLAAGHIWLLSAILGFLAVGSGP